MLTPDPLTATPEAKARFLLKNCGGKVIEGENTNAPPMPTNSPWQMYLRQQSNMSNIQHHHNISFLYPYNCHKAVVKLASTIPNGHTMAPTAIVARYPNRLMIGVKNTPIDMSTELAIVPINEMPN